MPPRRHLWTGCPVCGERAGRPKPPGESRNPGGEAGGVKAWRVLPDGMGWGALWWSCPLCGHGLSKPLDSGLRRNDGGGFRLPPGGTSVPGRSCQTRLCHLNPAGVPINDDITPRHLWTGCLVCGERAGRPKPPGARRNPGRGCRGGVGMAGFAGCPLPCRFSYPFLIFAGRLWRGRIRAAPVAPSCAGIAGRHG